MTALCSEPAKRCCADCKRNPDNVRKVGAFQSSIEPPKGEKCPFYRPMPPDRRVR